MSRNKGFSHTSTAVGEAFEEFVSRIEVLLDGPQFRVQRREIIRFGNRQIIKPDVTVRWKVGPTEHLMIIECRKRKHSSGPDWIREIVGRRNDLTRALRVTVSAVAVSNKPLTESAYECAFENNIQLRSLSELPILTKADIEALLAPAIQDAMFTATVPFNQWVRLAYSASPTDISRLQILDGTQISDPLNITEDGKIYCAVFDLLNFYVQEALMLNGLDLSATGTTIEIMLTPRQLTVLSLKRVDSPFADDGLSESLPLVSFLPDANEINAAAFTLSDYPGVVIRSIHALSTVGIVRERFDLTSASDYCINKTPYRQIQEYAGSNVGSVMIQVTDPMERKSDLLIDQSAIQKHITNRIRSRKFLLKFEA